MPQISDRSNWLRGDQYHNPDSPRSADRAWRLVLLGPPGVGKGTQARLLSDALGASILSTGDLFRDLAEREDTLGCAAALAVERMKTGQLVPDDLVIGLVRSRRRSFHCPSGFILDGFPRTAVQAIALDGLLATERLTVDLVIHYTLPTAGLIARMAGRRVCPHCQALYNDLTHPPTRHGVCDLCGTTLVRRIDDSPVAQYPELSNQNTSVAEVASHYERQGLLIQVDATASPDRVFARTMDILKSRTLAAELV